VVGRPLVIYQRKNALLSLLLLLLLLSYCNCNSHYHYYYWNPAGKIQEDIW